MSLRLPTDCKMAYLPAKKGDGVICHAVPPASLPEPALRHFNTCATSLPTPALRLMGLYPMPLPKPALRHSPHTSRGASQGS